MARRYSRPNAPLAIHHATTSMHMLGQGGSQVHPRGGYRLHLRRAVACGRGQAVCAADWLYAYCTGERTHRNFWRATAGWYAEGTVEKPCGEI
eukprot:2334099-Rhodomonas_salina.1